MNAEVVKAMNPKSHKENKVIKWWRKNYYKITRIIFFPIYFGVKGYDFLSEKYYHWVSIKNKWNEDRAKEILNYYIPRNASWNAENKQFFFFDNGYGWSIGFAKKYLKRKDRKFWKYNTGYRGGKIRDYLIYDFELDGFTKRIIDCYNGRTEITFTLEG